MGAPEPRDDAGPGVGSATRKDWWSHSGLSDPARVLAPLRNVGLFAAVYMAVYAAISTVVVAVGNAAGVATDSLGTTRGWISLVDPEPRLVIIASLLLSVINPNVAILLSGLGVLVTAVGSTRKG